MTLHKLQSALKRMQARGIATVTLREPATAKAGKVATWRNTELVIDYALQVIAGRESEFLGHGTGQRIQSIEYIPIDRAAKWEPCWRNTGAACIAFHGADQRSNA